MDNVRQESPISRRMLYRGSITVVALCLILTAVMLPFSYASEVNLLYDFRSASGTVDISSYYDISVSGGQSYTVNANVYGYNAITIQAGSSGSRTITCTFINPVYCDIFRYFYNVSSDGSSTSTLIVYNDGSIHEYNLYSYTSVFDLEIHGTIIGFTRSGSYSINIPNYVEYVLEDHSLTSYVPLDSIIGWVGTGVSAFGSGQPFNPILIPFLVPVAIVVVCLSIRAIRKFSWGA